MFLQRFNLIMISLACTDLLVGFITPFNTIRMGRWTLGYHFCQFVTSMVVILLSASIYNFVFVNLDRLFAIKMPLRYKEMKDKRWVVKLAILACWVLSLVPAIPMWIKSMDTRNMENDGTGCKCTFPYQSVSKLIYSILKLKGLLISLDGMGLVVFGNNFHHPHCFHHCHLACYPPSLLQRCWVK